MESVAHAASPHEPSWPAASSSSRPSSATTTSSVPCGRASGFFLKNAPPEELVNGVRVVADGDALLAPSVTRRVLEEYAQRPPPGARESGLERLTGRELEVMRLLAGGKGNAELAADL